MAKKKKVAPKKTVKSRKTTGVKKTVSRKGVKKSAVSKKTAGKKAASKKTAKKSVATGDQLAALRKKFLGGGAGSKATVKKSGDSTADSTSMGAAEAAVRAAMPNARIVKPQLTDYAADSQKVTVRGVPLRALKQKYDRGADAESLASAGKSLKSRSKVVYIASDDEDTDGPGMGPKAVVVKDGKPHSLQG